MLKAHANPITNAAPTIYPQLTSFGSSFAQRQCGEKYFRAFSGMSPPHGNPSRCRLLNVSKPKTTSALNQMKGFYTRGGAGRKEFAEFHAIWHAWDYLNQFSTLGFSARIAPGRSPMLTKRDWC